jgi:hypothetical protein
MRKRSTTARWLSLGALVFMGISLGFTSSVPCHTSVPKCPTGNMQQPWQDDNCNTGWVGSYHGALDIYTCSGRQNCDGIGWPSGDGCNVWVHFQKPGYVLSCEATGAVAFCVDETYMGTGQPQNRTCVNNAKCFQNEPYDDPPEDPIPPIAWSPGFGTAEIVPYNGNQGGNFGD